MTLDLTLILLRATAAINLWIGFYVSRRASNVGQRRAFVFMAFSMGLWTIGIALSAYGTAGHVWALRFAFSAASLIPLAVLSFTEHLAAGIAGRPRFGIRVFSPLAASLCLLSLTPWVVASMKFDQGIARFQYGAVHPFFAAYTLVCLGYSIVTLISKHRTVSGPLKLQIRYVLLAFAIPGALATITNLAVPLIFKSSGFSRYGPFFSLLVLLLIGHAIIRHRLMDMRVVIKRSVVYLAAFSVAGLILVTLLLASDVVYHDEHRIPIREIFLALVVAVFFTPLKNQIQRAFDRYLYRHPYDYQRTIREASRALADTIDLSTLLAYISQLLTRTLKAESVAIYLFDEDEQHFERIVGVGTAQEPTTLALSSPLSQELARARDSIFLDEIVGQATREPLEEELTRLRADVVVPLVEEEQVIGLFSLGAKRSGDPYYREDADLLTTLANQSAVAIRNAQTHQRVVQANEELQKILGTIGSGVIAVGRKGKITLFNRAAEQLTAVSERPGHPSLAQLPPPLVELISATAEDGQSRPQVEFSLPDAAGRAVPLVCSTTPLLGPAGVSIGAVAVISDLTHLKALEQERRRADHLASLEAIASGVVHEIRNPLVAIKTFTQLLPVRYGEEDFRDTFSRVAERELRRIEDLLTRLRTLSSVSSDPLEAVSISVPLHDTLETLRPVLDDRGIRLVQSVEGTPRPILGNASQLEQLFMNLCLNAIEAMQPGGELGVKVAEVSEGHDSALRVEISDTGCGIPEELLATIFDPFFTTKVHGTGLGLAICRSIADVHHARLSASSAPQGGSTFVIEFPVPVSGGARVRT